LARTDNILDSTFRLEEVCEKISSLLTKEKAETYLAVWVYDLYLSLSHEALLEFLKNSICAYIIYNFL